MPKWRAVVNTWSALSLSRVVPCRVGQGVRACRMLRPKLTLHVGEHALTDICHRQPISTTRVHSAQGTRVQLWTSFPFNRDPISPSARPVARSIARRPRLSEILKQISVRDDEPDETIAGWREGCQIRVHGSDANNNDTVLYDESRENARWCYNRTSSHA